jgi:hypothetical protein
VGGHVQPEEEHAWPEVEHAHSSWWFFPLPVPVAGLAHCSQIPGRTFR